jgi:hypothetical protein
MHNLEQTYKTIKYNSCIFFILLYLLSPQYSFSLDDPILTSSTDQIVTDSVFTVSSNEDSVIQNYFSKLNVNHNSRRVHPYFRDSYRVVEDIRRLIRMFDYRVVNGYESMNDLIDICRKFPEKKQTEMIYTAMAGGVVNLVSEQTNKLLRKMKIHFLQWRLEKVYFRNRFKFFYMNLHKGMNSRGIGFSIPTLRIHYYRQSTSYYLSEGIIVLPMQKIGINYSRWNGRTIITPFYSSRFGTFALTYDIKSKIIHSTLDLKKSSSYVIRIVYINFLDRRHSDRLLSELLFYW